MLWNRTAALICASLLLLTSSVPAQNPLEQIWKRPGSLSIGSLSETKIASGVKEALKVSTTRAVAETGRPDGFLKNEAIKILLPEKIRKASTGLRMIGMGPQLDELEIGMNRAAEKAAPEAKRIFLNALMQMTFDDARHILAGDQTAATEYFREKTSQDLTAAFTPIVQQAMQNVGVVRQYKQLTKNPLAAQLMKNQNVDIDSYVVNKTLDGLFYMVGEEEKKIRQNPAARTTAILREVFGARR